MGLVHPEPVKLALHRLRVNGPDEAVAEAQRVAMNLESPHEGQQLGDVVRLEMLAPRQRPRRGMQGTPMLVQQPELPVPLVHRRIEDVGIYRDHARFYHIRRRWQGHPWPNAGGLP